MKKDAKPPQTISRTGYVYLIHLNQPLAPGRHTAQHYLGWTTNLPTRLRRHKNGHRAAARFTQVAHQRGIKQTLVRVWHGGRDFERQLKNRKEGPRLCPICGHAIGIYPNELSPDEINNALIPF